MCMRIISIFVLLSWSICWAVASSFRSCQKESICRERTMLIKNGLWWCVHIWGWGGTCKVGHKWFWNGIHKQLCKGDTAEDEGLRDHYLHLQRERTGQGHVQLIPSVAVTETCGSLVNRAYRVLQAEVLQNWKYHNPLRCCSYWIKLHNKLGFFFFYYPLTFKYNYAKLKK